MPYSLGSLDLDDYEHDNLNKICQLQGIEKKHFYAPYAVVSICITS